MSRDIFLPTTAYNFNSLQMLFSGKSELGALKKLTRDEIEAKGREGAGFWSITWELATGPITVVEHLFVKSAASMLDALRLTRQAKCLHLRANKILHPLGIAWQRLIHGSSLLMPSFYDCQEDTADVYSLPSVPRAAIGDKVIQSQLNPRLNKVSFDHVGKGLCHGAVRWFNYLFLKAQNDRTLRAQAPSVKELAKRVATQFKEGQPRQATLLQSFYGLSYALLGIHQKDYKLKSGEIEQLGRFIKQLPGGVYDLKLPYHSVTYIKEGKEQLIWDPNHGLIQVNRTQELKTIIQDYIPKGSDQSIYFAKQTLKSPYGRRQVAGRRIGDDTLVSLSLICGAWLRKH
jgi:hypothetical protein